MKFALQPEPTLVQRLSARLYTLIFVRDPDFVEVAAGLLMFAWGLQLLAPWGTFTSATGYRAMAALAPEAVWGGMLAWIGITQVGSYLFDHWRVRVASALGACMAWTFLGVLFGITNPYGTGIIVYPFLAAMCAWVFWRTLTGGRTP